MTTSDDPPTLNYVSPATERRERNDGFERRLGRVGRQLLLGVILLFAVPFLPVPQGIWYFGHRPQWVLAIDSGGLTLGPYARPVKVLGFVPLIALELVLLTVPFLLGFRYLRWRRRGRPAAR